MKKILLWVFGAQIVTLNLFFVLNYFFRWYRPKEWATSDYTLTFVVSLIIVIVGVCILAIVLADSKNRRAQT